MTRAVLSIGSNLGDRLAVLRAAAARFAPWAAAVSPVYETPPWGPVPQGPYLNAVLVVDDPDADPDTWLRRAHEAESAAGRVRDVRWGPRTLDVDVIDVEGVVSDDPRLTLPHPRAAARAFVLVPWRDAEPEAVLAGTALPDLLAALPAGDVASVRRLDESLR